MATSGTRATTIPATTATTEWALSTPIPAPTPTSSPASAPPIPAHLRPADTSTEDTEAGAGNGGNGTSSGDSKPTATSKPPVEAPPAREPKAPDAPASQVRSAIAFRVWRACIVPPAASTPTRADTPSSTTRMLDLGGIIKFMRSGVLPASHASSQGCANIKPTRAVIPLRRGLDANSFVVGVPAHAAAYRSDTHVQDGYGGVENLLVFDGLSNQDLDDLAQIVGSQSEVRSMVLRPCPGPDDQPLEKFEAFPDSLLVRRQMASVFRQFEGERFAEPGLSFQDTPLRSKHDSLASDYGFLEAYHEQERKSLQDVKSQPDRELSVAADGRAVRETWLTDQVQKLEDRLTSATQIISRLEKAKQVKAFDADKPMTFLHENQGSIRGRWTRLRHLIQQFERSIQPPAGWKTWLNVEAADKPYRAMPPLPNALDHDSEASDDVEIVVSDGDGAPDQDSKSEEKPPASSLLLGNPAPDVAPTEKSPSGASARKRPAKQSHRSSKAMTLVEMETPHGAAGFSYSQAVKMMGDDAVAHHEFPEADLRNMITQMMYHRWLDETLWTRYVPDKYFRTTEIALTARLLVGNYPSEKLCNVRDDSLSAHETIDEDYNSKDEAEVQPVNDGGTLSNDEPGTATKDIPAKKSSKKATSQSKAHLKRQRHSSGSSSEPNSDGKGSTYTPSSKRPRPPGSNGRSKSRLAQLKYDELSEADKAVIEPSGLGIISWRRRGILCRFSPKKDGTEGQTPGFPDYAPQLSDIVFLKRPIAKHIQFMKDNSRAFWDMLHWFVMKTQPEMRESAGSRSDAYATSSAIYADRSTRHVTVGRGFEKRLERMFQRGVPRTIVWEPGFWLYPLKVCYLFLAHRKPPNSSGGKFTLEQQVEAAEREFPACTQWTAYCSDIDRFAHVPKEVRDQRKPEDVRRRNPIHSRAADVLL
ncbi:hypothetical protein PHMEG_00016788 [Phytophthora megakarya]|uniref:Uncharacterized protein n=1 Tax=Phytophthora megakarya TaxID=4795 RepID=A0A225VYE4_9STRA|nr:hypothetical protein PHMEG_00016788 [Phytophthora megakarya]